HHCQRAGWAYLAVERDRSCCRNFEVAGRRNGHSCSNGEILRLKLGLNGCVRGDVHVGLEIAYDAATSAPSGASAARQERNSQNGRDQHPSTGERVPHSEMHERTFLLPDEWCVGSASPDGHGDSWPKSTINGRAKSCT